MATHSSSLAWRIPWTEEPGGLQSMGSQSRTGLSDFTSLTICRSSLIAQMVKIRLQHKRSRFNLWVRKSPWRKKWQPIPVLLPGKSHGQRSLVGCSPRGREESDTTSLSLFTFMYWRRKWQPTGVAQSRTQLKRLSSSSSKHLEECLDQS